MNSLDMTVANGGIGGSSGFLDWGSDIARMWGLGIHNGLNLANAMRDMALRSQLEPGYTEAAWMQNQIAKEQAQNQFTEAYDQNRADMIRHQMAAGVFDPSGQLNGQGVVNTNPQAMQRQISVAPNNMANTAVPNGINNGGYTNALPKPVGVTSQTTANALNLGLTNQYGYGG